MQPSIFQWDRRDYGPQAVDWFWVKIWGIILLGALSFFLYVITPTVHATPAAAITTQQQACEFVKEGMPVGGNVDMSQVRALCAASGVSL